MVLMGNRRPEERHEAITQELIDSALIAMDSAQRQLKKMVQDGMHGLWPELLRQARVIRQVTEEHGDLLALPLQRRVGGEDFLHQVLRSVGAWLPHGLAASDG